MESHRLIIQINQDCTAFSFSERNGCEAFASAELSSEPSDIISGLCPKREMGVIFKKGAWGNKGFYCDKIGKTTMKI